jgi:hypothetical protein
LVTSETDRIANPLGYEELQRIGENANVGIEAESETRMLIEQLR